MYLRTVKVRDKSGAVREYVRLVEAYWDNGQSKQRVIANLGRKDLLAPHLDSLTRILEGEQGHENRIGLNDVRAEQAACWGPMLVATKLWQELGLEQILDSCERKKPSGDKARLSDRVLVLVANRLCQPSSEHRLAEWLETDFACDREGNRFLPVWKQQGRVRVDLNWLQRWYRTLDELLVHKPRIEQELFGRLRTLFSFNVEMVFYDITSAYFEGDGPAGFAKHGYSRDGKPRNKQVVVGLVMIDGWPIAHHVFRGNLQDQESVADVIVDLEQRFGLKRVVFVGDRGMVTSSNLNRIKEGGHGYLVGLKRRRNKAIYELIQRATGEWIECPSRGGQFKTFVQEVKGDQPGVRIFVVSSEERTVYERAMREKSMERTRQKLEKLAARVESGRLKAAEKIGEAAGRILAANHGHRYYGWELTDGKFRFFEHPVHLESEKALEGKYLIQTEEQNLTPVEAVEVYKELSEVERGFREIKDVIEMRPIYHRTKQRVQAHIFIAALAFLLDRALEKKLKAVRASLSAAQALRALRTIHIVDIEAAGRTKSGVTTGSANARQVLSALAITDPNPPKNARTLRPSD
jgi:transposase